jgi:uncharacterized protein (TIGR03435 family)
MVQVLLSERFKVQLHNGVKETTAFAVVVAKAGAKLQAGTSSARPYQFATRGKTAGTTVLTGTNVPLSRLVSFVSDRLGRPVTDETDLIGSYDYTLTWTPDFGELDGLNLPAPERANISAPTLTIALEEQLGLRLQNQKRQMQVLVIDSAQRPRID